MFTNSQLSNSLWCFKINDREMKYIALIAHDRLKNELVEWVRKHQDQLKIYDLIATNHTGAAIRDELGLKIRLTESGPMGGDVMVANQILEGNVEKLVFFIDSLAPMPHDPDIRTLIRIATIKNIPFALNPATADLLFP
jgi:methylglyoxal synthase